mgnify:CR=1 FL=1
MGPQWRKSYNAVTADAIAGRYDLVVVGAGPAGIMAAVEGARSCERVLLVEAGELPREKSCGGMLNLYTRRALEPYGGVPEEMVLDPRWIYFRYFHMDYDVKKATEVKFLNVDRKMFDEWLMSLLPANVDVAASTRLSSVSQGPAEVLCGLNGLDALGARVPKTVRASYLIAGDGPRATVRERLGIRPFDRYITVQEYVKIEPGELDPYFDCICSKEFPPEYGIGYIMPKGDVAIVGSIFYPGSRDCEAKHEKILDRLRETYPYPLGESVKRESWIAAHLRRPADLVAGRGRILLAGEGGGFLSCTSGEGISFALNSGIKAGRAVAASVAEGPLSTDGALRRYEEALRPMKRNLAVRMAMFPFMNSSWGKKVACAIPTPIVSKATEHL